MTDGTGGRPVLEVLEPGALLSVQDGGRPGYAGEGVTAGGAADTWSLAVANVLAGNAPDAAALEATLTGPVLRALVRVTVALAGSMPGRVRETGANVVPGSSVRLEAGQTLVVGDAVPGARGYLAVPGGVDVPVVLGSRGTALGAGFGGLDGRALRSGDVVRAGGAPAHDPAPAWWPGEAAPPPVTASRPIRVLPGPHAARHPGALDALVARSWTVSPRSDRVGIRLDGTAMPVEPAGTLATLAVVQGAIQVPPDGRPIVLLADHQPTGGYPVVAVVVTADLARLGQLAPGGAVPLAASTPGGARAALEERDHAFADALGRLRHPER
jgi:biotin-dependent carboxylase-like uncharacterized protein